MPAHRGAGVSDRFYFPFERQKTSYLVNKSQDEIYVLIDRCIEKENEGGSIYPGMIYEQGIKAALEWVMGMVDEH